jgi:hypothetical protein
MNIRGAQTSCCGRCRNWPMLARAARGAPSGLGPAPRSHATSMVVAGRLLAAGSWRSAVRWSLGTTPRITCIFKSLQRRALVPRASLRRLFPSMQPLRNSASLDTFSALVPCSAGEKPTH